MSNFLPPFQLIRRNGETMVFSCLTELAIAARATKISIGEYHVSHELSWWDSVGSHQIENSFNEWIVRDDAGKIVSSGVVWNHLPYRESYRNKRLNLVKHAESLGLPIPGIGRWRRSRYYRRPKNIGARREAALCSSAVYRDDKLPGNVKKPPSSWDDRRRVKIDDRSWKNYRKHQYHQVVKE